MLFQELNPDKSVFKAFYRRVDIYMKNMITFKMARLYLCVLLGIQSAIVLAADDFILGVSTSINDPASVVIAAKGLGSQSIRVDAPWNQMEEKIGQYKLPQWLVVQLDAMQKNGIEPLLILDYGNKARGIDKPKTEAEINAFADYAEWLVKTLHGRVRMFEIWNEWNNTSGGGPPGSAEDYVKLAKIVYPRLKAAAPDVIFFGGSPSGGALRGDWMERFIAAGGYKYCDAVSIHPYTWWEKKMFSPEDAIDVVDNVETMLRKVNKGKDFPLYITEVGWPTHIDEKGTPISTSGAYLARFMLLANARPYVKGVWWFTVFQSGDDNDPDKEHHFGLFDKYKAPKSSAKVYKQVSQLFASTNDRLKALRNDQEYAVMLPAAADSTMSYIAWKPSKKREVRSSFKYEVITSKGADNITADLNDYPVFVEKFSAGK